MPIQSNGSILFISYYLYIILALIPIVPIMSKRRYYQDSYVEFGFIFMLDRYGIQKPQCVLRSGVLQRLYEAIRTPTAPSELPSWEC